MNSQHDQRPADEGWERKQTLPGEEKSEGEKRISEHDPSPSDDGWVGKNILAEDWKSKGGTWNSTLSDEEKNCFKVLKNIVHIFLLGEGKMYLASIEETQNNHIPLGSGKSLSLVWYDTTIVTHLE